MRILLVEDDELLGDGLAAGLRHCGYNVSPSTIHSNRENEVMPRPAFGNWPISLFVTHLARIGC